MPNTSTDKTKKKTAPIVKAADTTPQAKAAPAHQPPANLPKGTRLREEVEREVRIGGFSIREKRVREIERK